MGISGGKSILKTACVKALGLKGASAKRSSTIIAGALAAVLPMGKYTATPYPFPLPPSGIPATKSLFKKSLSLGKGAKPDKVAKVLAAGVAVACPIVPPSGKSALETAVKKALSDTKGATPKKIGKKIADAIIKYYQSSGVVS